MPSLSNVYSVFAALLAGIVEVTFIAVPVSARAYFIDMVTPPRHVDLANKHLESFKQSLKFGSTGVQ